MSSISSIDAINNKDNYLATKAAAENNISVNMEHDKASTSTGADGAR